MSFSSLAHQTLGMSPRGHRILHPYTAYSKLPCRHKGLELFCRCFSYLQYHAPVLILSVVYASFRYQRKDLARALKFLVDVFLRYASLYFCPRELEEQEGRLSVVP